MKTVLLLEVKIYRAGDLVHILEQLIEARTDIDVVNQADLIATDVLHQVCLIKIGYVC